MKKFISILIKKLDRSIVKLAGWKHIPNSQSNFMYLNPYKYKGRSITLRDGTFISKGDVIAEIHLDNANIKMLDVSYGNLSKLLKGELIALKNCFHEEPYSKIKAIYGISAFYNIASRHGFTIRDMDSFFKKLFISLGENLLRFVFRKASKKSRKRLIVSKECWLSRDQILMIK